VRTKRVGVLHPLFIKVWAVSLKGGGGIQHLLMGVGYLYVPSAKALSHLTGKGDRSEGEQKKNPSILLSSTGGKKPQQTFLGEAIKAVTSNPSPQEKGSASLLERGESPV